MATIKNRIIYARNAGRDGDIREAAAPLKRSRAYACYTVGDCDIRETSAARKCIVADARNAGGDGDIRETSAARKCIVADACYTVGDCYACEIGAAIKCPIAYACYTVVDNYCCNSKPIISPWYTEVVCMHVSRAGNFKGACQFVKAPSQVISASAGNHRCLRLRFAFRDRLHFADDFASALAADGDRPEYNYHA